MNKKDLEFFKKKLLAEQSQLESDLSQVAERNPENPSEWQANTKDIEVDSADENEVADKLEEYESHGNIAKQLENQLNEVKAALGRIQNGGYGLCETCGEPIERERLEANPSSRISIKHQHAK